ncbi:MAG: hypothetical protein ACYC2X_09325 [Coriobacteriia bacterium]
MIDRAEPSMHPEESRALRRLHWAAFLRRRPMWLSAFAFLMFVIGMGGYELHLWLQYGYGGLEALGFSTRYLIIWPIFSLVFTYEFLSQPARDRMDECVDGLPHSAEAHWRSMLAVPWTALAVAFAAYLILREAVVLLSSTAHLLFVHVAMAAVLDVLIPSSIALLFGIVLARRASRFAAYASVVVFVLVIGPFAELVPFTLMQATAHSVQPIDIYPLYDYFQILAPDSLWFVDALYGFPMEFKRWMIAALWLAVLGLAALPALLATRRAQVRVTAALLAALFLGLSLLPGGELRKDTRPNGSEHAKYHYYKAREQAESPPDFRVSRYDMVLAAGRNLSATVTMSLTDDTHSDAYRFTLYHGYTVRSVKDASGEDLDYSQDGDYVSIRSTEDQQSLRLEYDGSGDNEYANYQGIFLPGDFPYYPVPGFAALWDEESQLLRNVAGDLTPTDFSVEFKAHVPVVSNLPQTSSGMFAGRTVAPTFIGGLVSQARIGDTTVIHYPAAGYRIEAPSGNPESDGLSAMLAGIADLERELGIEPSVLDTGTVIVQSSPSASSRDATVVLPGTIFVPFFDVSNVPYILLANAPYRADRLSLRYAFDAYAVDRIAFREEYAKTPAPTADEVARLEEMRLSADEYTRFNYGSSADGVVRALLYQKTLSDGEPAALRATYEYLMSDDARSELQWLTARSSAEGEEQ